MSQPEIVLNCQSCGGKLRAPRSAIGTTVGCPGCKTGVYVPDPTPTLTPNKGFTPSVMIVDPRRKLGVESRKDTAATSVEDAFKERLRRTTEDTYRVDPNNPVMKRRDMRKLKHSKNLTNWDTAPQRRQRSARSRRILFALYCATAVILLVMVGMFGGFTIIFGLSESYWLSLLALAGLAAADMISVFIRSTLGPLLTPASLRGRVGAAERVFIGASNELGAFESGVMARLIGTVPAIVLGGVASIGIAALWAIFFPALRKIDRFEDIEPAETDLR